MVSDNVLDPIFRVTFGRILPNLIQSYVHTVKPVLSSHSKNDKTKVFKTNVRLMKFKSIAANFLTCIKQ